ncbi:YidC/Oxa1 family membrane protein insertase [bacterium]|nr:MAG: YidC/Oxa1 family membrane protein insertase [bacterium]
MYPYLAIAFPDLLKPIVDVMTVVLKQIDAVTHSYALSLLIFALLITVVLWPLRHQQYKSMAEMQALAPHLKRLQQKYKGDAQKLQAEQMALYKEHGVNPMAGCLPLLIQMPILFSLYRAIFADKDAFGTAHFLWIGSPLATAFPKIVAASLAAPDVVLLALYVISMYFTVRYSSPVTDPQQAQQQKIMALISPLMIAFVGRGWPSALILYWLAYNVFSTAQQIYLMRTLKHSIPPPAEEPASESKAEPSKRQQKRAANK